MNELPTIKLKGKDYVMVKDRILHFNEEYPHGSIVTDFKMKEDNSYAWFTATVCPDASSVDKMNRLFVAHSGGPIDDEKSLEKLETVAVGRALAYMGIGVIESIASADEMDNFFKKSGFPKHVSKKAYIKPPEAKPPEFDAEFPLSNQP